MKSSSSLLLSSLPLAGGRSRLAMILMTNHRISVGAVGRVLTRHIDLHHPVGADATRPYIQRYYATEAA